MHPLKSDEIHVNWRLSHFTKNRLVGGMKTNERLDKWRWIEAEGLRTHASVLCRALLVYYIHKMWYHCSSESLFVELNLANEIHIAAIFLLPIYFHFCFTITYSILCCFVSFRFFFYLTGIDVLGIVHAIYDHWKM